MKKNNIYVILGLVEKELHHIFDDIAQTSIELSECAKENKETLNEHFIIQVNYSKRLIECIDDLKSSFKEGQ